MPQREGYESLLTRADEVLLVRLAAFLRVAEFLDLGRTAAVDDVLVSWDDDFVCFTLIAGRYSTRSPKPPSSPDAAAPSPIRR